MLGNDTTLENWKKKQKTTITIGELFVLVPCTKIYTFKSKTQQGVCHTVALPFTLKRILRQKKNYKNSNISPCKNTLIFKKSSKTNQNPSRYYDSITTNLKFQHKQKHSSFKNPHIKIDLLPKGQDSKSLKLLYSIMNLDTISLPW
jgi:hypothetical protein